MGKYANKPVEPAAPMDEREVTVLRILFFQEDSGFVIMKCETEKSRAKGTDFVVKGKMPEKPTPGEKYRIKGSVNKETKGNFIGQWYFSVKEAELLGGRSAKGWEEYLEREGPHIGGIRAAELVARYGENVIAKMAEDRMNVRSMSGMTDERADELHAWAKGEVFLSQVKSWLYRHGLKQHVVRKIVLIHGNNTPNIIKQDTYKLIEIDGIGWKTADDIATKVGLPKDNPRRISCGVKHAIQTMLEEGGHTCVFHDRLVREAQELLDVDKKLIEAAITVMLTNHEICTQHTNVMCLTKRPHLFHQGESDAA